MNDLAHAANGLAERVTAAIEADERLDRPAYAINNAVSETLRPLGRAAQPLENALHGTGLGHPLHPILVTLPIGTWTLALVLDAIEVLGPRGDPRTGMGIARAADAALVAGAVGAVGAAATGMADWRQVHGKDRRTGLVHGMVNSLALAMNLGSIALRRRNRRRAGQALSAAAWGTMGAGAYLGGHLVYRRRVGVDQADRSPEPRGWQDVAALDDLPEDRPHRVAVWDPDARAEVGIALVFHRGAIRAMGSRCSHMGGPLDQGWIERGGLVCPWHGSRYCLRTGRAMDGPSTAPQPVYETRVRGGRVEVRRVPEPGDEALRPEEVERERRRPVAPPPPGARDAREVLREHHDLMRALFRRVEAMDRDDPERRDVMRTLAGELEIHERVEDEIFYPAVRPVSEDVPAAHAEHQQLSDMLAVTLRLGTHSAAFEEKVRALHQGVDHHASAEETSMFAEADRLGENRLRHMGAEIEAMLDELRASRASSAFRDLKIRLLEGA